MTIIHLEDYVNPEDIFTDDLRNFVGDEIAKLPESVRQAYLEARKANDKLTDALVAMLKIPTTVDACSSVSVINQLSINHSLANQRRLYVAMHERR